MCCFMDKLLSRKTPRFFTWVENGIDVSEMKRLGYVGPTAAILNLAPMSIASVLLLLSCNFISVIHVCISEIEFSSIVPMCSGGELL